MKKYGIQIRGKYKEWLIQSDNPDTFNLRDFGSDCFNDCVDGYRVIQVGEIQNTIPKWYIDLGLPVKLWCALQDLFGG